MDAALIRLVRQRADGRCEYCRMPQAADDATFEIDQGSENGTEGISKIRDNLINHTNKIRYGWVNFLRPLFTPKKDRKPGLTGPTISGWLTAAGCDAVRTLDLPDGNRTTDAQVNDLADREQRAVVTKDADFVDSHVLRGQPAKLLLISTGNISNRDLYSARSGMKLSLP